MPNLNLQQLHLSTSPLFSVFLSPDFSQTGIYRKTLTYQWQPHLFNLQALPLSQKHSYIWAQRGPEGWPKFQTPPWHRRHLVKKSLLFLYAAHSLSHTDGIVFDIFVSAEVFNYMLKFPLNSLWFWINTELSSKEAANESHIQAFSPVLVWALVVKMKVWWGSQ